MTEFPEDICRLVNQFVPWDRHHRSPVAQIVTSHHFQAKQGKCIERWRRAYIGNGAYTHGTWASWLLPNTTWETVHDLLSIEREISVLRAMEEVMLEYLDSDEETETDEEEDGGDDESDEPVEFDESD